MNSINQDSFFLLKSATSRLFGQNDISLREFTQNALPQDGETHGDVMRSMTYANLNQPCSTNFKGVPKRLIVNISANHVLSLHTV